MTKLASVVNLQLSDASQLNQLITLNTGGQVYDVKNGYGAVGDGVTDDTAAINNAITAANAAGGGIVYLPPGTYYLGSGPIFNASAAISNVWLMGAGMNSVTIKANGALTGGNADLIRITIATGNTYADTISITDMTLDCSAQTAGNGMTLQGANNLRLENVRVIKSFGYGIAWGSVGGATPYIVNPAARMVHLQGCGRGGGSATDSFGGGGITNGLIEDYWCGDAADGTHPGGTAWDHTNMSGFTIQRGYALTTGTPNAAAFGTDFGAVDVTMRDLWVSGWQYAVLLVSQTGAGLAKDVTIDGLHVVSVRAVGVFFNFTAGNGGQRIKVINSDFAVWDTLAGANPAIQLDGGHDVIVANNTFGAVTTAYAIRIRGDNGSTTLNPPTQMQIFGNDVSLATNTIFPQFLDPNGTVIIRGNPGYNPVGVVTPAVPASGVAVAQQPYDRMFWITTGAGATTMAIQNGPTITLAASLAGQCVRVPAGRTLTPTYTNAPTWVVEGE